jgi:hypothetical protein
VETRAFRRDDPAHREAWAASAVSDHLAAGALESFASVQRIEIAGGAAARGTLLTSLDLSGVPSVLLGRSLDARRPATICPAPRGALFADPAIRRESIGGRRSSFGDGWDPAERRQGVTTRRLARPEGEVLVSLARAMPIDVVLSVIPDGTGGTITLRINGTAIDTTPLRTDAALYRWTVPASLWKAGVNQVVVLSQPGIRISEIELLAGR